MRSSSFFQFQELFKDAIYLLYKNHLYNFLIRRSGVRRRFPADRFKKILELGCGISPLLEHVDTPTTLTDISWDALNYARSFFSSRKNRKWIVCDGEHLPFQDEGFDCIVCSEVLEHIEKDDAVLDEISRILERGGELFLTAPIQPHRFGFDDQLVGHYRRYETERLVENLTRRGFGRFEIHPLLGSLEKWIMEKAAGLFLILHKIRIRARPGPFSMPLRALAWGMLPFYIFANRLLVWLVSLQARFILPEKAVNVLIRCQRLS